MFEVAGWDAACIRLVHKVGIVGVFFGRTHLFFGKRVQNGGTVLLDLNNVLVAYGEELDDFGQHALARRVNQAGDHFVSDVARTRP